MELPDYAFHGTTTVGERGQAVIPAAVRTQLGLNTGEKLLVFTLNDDTVVLTRLEGMARFVERIDAKVAELKDLALRAASSNE